MGHFVLSQAAFMGIDGFTAYPPKDRELYNRRRWWLGMTYGDLFDKATDLYPEKVGKVDKKALREDIRRRLKENGSDVATTGWAKDG